MQKSTPYRRISAVISAIKKINGWLERRRIHVYAAQASFFMIISSVPMLILTLTLVGTFLPKEESAVVEVFLSSLPSELTPVMRHLIAEVSGKADGGALSVSALTLLWSASRGVRSIGVGVRNAAGGKKRGGYLFSLLKSVLYTVLYVASVLLVLLVLVFGDSLFSLLPGTVPLYTLRFFNRLAVFILLTSVFLLTYRGFIGEKTTFASLLPGALFASSGWFLYSFFFEMYVENYANYSNVYGSLSALVIVMLWFYACMEIFLIGAGLNAYLKRGLRILW